MAITGAVAAAVRRFDPWHDFDEVYDFAGVRTGGEPFFKTPDRRRWPLLRAVPATTFTRATTAITTDADGTLRAVASGEPAIGRGRGMEFWPAIQNKNTNNNLNPADAADWAFSGVGSVERVARADLPTNVRAALEAVDPRGLVGALVKTTLTEGAGPSTAQVPGVVGALTAHTGAIFAFVESLTGQAQFGLLGLTVPELTAITAVTPGFVRISSSIPAPGVTTRRLGFRIGSGANGAVIWSFGNTLTETAYVPPLIAVAGAATTRNADVHVKTGLAPNPAGFAVYDQGSFGQLATQQAAWSLDDGTTSNRVEVLTTSASLLRFLIVPGVQNGPTAVVPGQSYKSILRFNGAGTFDFFVNGALVASNPQASPPGLNTLRLGQSAVSNRWRQGVQAAFALRNRPLSDAECITLTAL